MAYTSNVPQANQQIAATQGPINANFQFLLSSIGQEHNFDVSDATKTYHLKASMPNMVDPIALPPGINGIYYVKGGQPWFYNGTAFQINTFGNLLYATGAANLGGGAAVTIITPGKWTGFASIMNFTDGEAQLFSFYSSGSGGGDTLTAINLAAINADTDIELQFDGSKNIQILNGHSGNKNFKWNVFYSVGQ